MTGGSEKALIQYLSRYAEPEATVAASLPLGDYPRCVVIPARDETWADIVAALAEITERFLLILIVNAPDDEPTTLRLLEDVRRAGQCVASSQGVDYLRADFPFDILLVDRCSPSRVIPRQQGVGLARKLGADIGLALMHRQIVEPGFIYCTDADAHLPADYFGPRHCSPEVAAQLYPFVHEAAPPLQEATSLYEVAMLYYAAGLEYAGSPYAFPTLGSCLAISMQHYAQVRGFPRRNAAEDFYMLNKLAKTGRIRLLPAPVIRVAGRLSHRVPFGTGVGIAKIAGLDHPLGDFLFYHPRIFSLLRQWLDLFGRAWHAGDAPRAMDQPAEIAAWMAEHGAADIIADNLARAHTEAVFRKAMHDWFDGGKTLRFVHFMRDRFLPSVPLGQLNEADFVSLATNEAANLSALRATFMGQLFSGHNEAV